MVSADIKNKHEIGKITPATNLHFSTFIPKRIEWKSIIWTRKIIMEAE